MVVCRGRVRGGGGRVLWVVSSVTCGWAAGRERLQGGVGLEGNADAGEDMEAVEEVGVEREAEVGEGAELRRGYAGSPAASIPAAAVEASARGADWSSTVTRTPRWWSSRARERPMMPAPAMQMSGWCME